MLCCVFVFCVFVWGLWHVLWAQGQPTQLPMNNTFSGRTMKVPWDAMVVQFIWNWLSELLLCTYRVLQLYFPALKAGPMSIYCSCLQGILQQPWLASPHTVPPVPTWPLAFNPDLLSSLATYQFHHLSLIAAQNVISSLVSLVSVLNLQGHNCLTLLYPCLCAFAHSIPLYEVLFLSS